jgi:type IV pilus assembly protein PilM
LSSLASIPASLPLPKRLAAWLDAIPHPAVGVEIAEAHVAAIRWPQHAVELLPAGAVSPSPVDMNLSEPGAVGTAVRRVLEQIQGRGPDVALLIPDQVVRVFLLHFETLPRRSDEAIPLLRWRLKKSVPFDVEDTVVSYAVQPGPPGAAAGVEVLTAVARQRVVRQYEEAVESAGFRPGVVMSSTLATLSYFEDERPTLLARLTGRTLTTVIVRGASLCVYRCTEMPAAAEELDPQALLEEIYPAVAYYQDTWKGNLDSVCLAGLGERFEEFRRAVEAELRMGATRLTPSAALGEPVSGMARATLDRYLDALVGWMRNRGA